MSSMSLDDVWQVAEGPCPPIIGLLVGHGMPPPLPVYIVLLLLHYLVLCHHLVWLILLLSFHAAESSGQSSE